MGAGGGSTTSGGLLRLVSNENVVDVVEAAMEDETSNAEKTPTVLPDENGVQNMAPLRGRTWTLAHNKALLYVVRDEDGCFLDKRTNIDKTIA